MHWAFWALRCVILYAGDGLCNKAAVQAGRQTGRLHTYWRSAERTGGIHNGGSSDGGRYMYMYMYIYMTLSEVSFSLALPFVRKVR